MTCYSLYAEERKVGKNSSAKLSPLQCCKAKEKRRITNHFLSLTWQTLGCSLCFDTIVHKVTKIISNKYFVKLCFH